MSTSPNITNTSKDYFFIAVQWASLTVLLGRAWQHLFWDAPFRALLWDESLMSGFVTQWLSMPWESYITSIKVDDFIQALIQGFGVFYLLAAIVALFIRQLPRWISLLLPLASLALMLLAALYCKEKFYSLGQFFEYALQFSAPLLLYALVNTKISRVSLVWWMKIAILLTFTCHGLYAIGFYPRPGNFVDMTLQILPLSEAQAYQYLELAGILDFLASLGLFLAGKWRTWSLYYLILWGFATSMARICANFYFDAPLESLHEWLFETVMRFPHFLIPLAVYFYYKKRG